MAVEQLQRHTPDDPLYATEHTRRCLRCGETKQLWIFRPTDNDPAKQMMVTNHCGPCRAIINPTWGELQKAKADQALAKSQTGISKAMQTLGAALKSKTKLAQLHEACPDPVAGARKVVEAMGGETVVWELIGTTLKAAMENGAADARMKAVSTALNYLTQMRKLQGEPINLDALEDEQMFAICMSAARELVLADADFRRELINEPDVRIALMSEFGVDTIDAETTGGDE